MIAAAIDNIRARLVGLVGEELSGKLARGGVTALLIKIGAAGLQYLMFLALARAMSVEDFGRLGFAFSLATLLGVAGSLGQRTLILRFAPIYDAGGEKALLTGVVREGYRLVLGGCAVLGFALAIVALTWPGLEQRSYLVAAGAFTVVLGLVEYQGNVLRSLGCMALSLAPRDLVWRGGVIALTAAIAFWFGNPLTAVGGVVLMVVVLAAVTVGQALSHPATRPRALFADSAIYERPMWRSAALGMWGTSVVRAGAPNLAVVLLGVLLKPEATGPFFAAQRTAMLLNIFIVASNLVAAPLIARLHHSRQVDRIERVSTVVAWGATIPALAVFLTFILFGDRILSLFGAEFTVAQTPMILIASGLLINAAAGQNNLVMQMCGHERTFFYITLGCNVGAIVLLIILAPILNMTGAAISVMLSFASWNLISQYWIKKNLHMDPSILGILKGTSPSREGGR